MINISGCKFLKKKLPLTSQLYYKHLFSLSPLMENNMSAGYVWITIYLIIRIWTLLHVIYEGESVNRSQMAIKRKTCEIWTWKKMFISQHILHQHWYTCPITIPVRRNPQHRSLLTVVSATFAPPFQPLRHQRNICYISGPSCKPLYVTKTSHCKQETFLCEYPLHWVLLPTKKTHNRMLLLGTTILIWPLKPASEHLHLTPRLS
jgi:hypothetical protein